MPTDETAQADLRVLRWSPWRAPLARVRTQFTDGAFDDSASPPAGNVQDESMASLVVVAWQDSRAPLARLLRQFTPGAFDDSAGGGAGPAEPDTAQWQPPRVRSRPWVRNPYIVTSQPWDGDGPAPAGFLDGPAADLRIIRWSPWQAPRARLLSAVTDAPQDLDGFAPPATPDQSLVVVAWFAGRVPMEQIRNLIWSGEQTDVSGPAPDLFLNAPEFIAGRTSWRGTRWSPRARVAYALANLEENLQGPPLSYNTGYIPTIRPRRR
jgi:hypothetical protein